MRKKQAHPKKQAKAETQTEKQAIRIIYPKNDNQRSLQNSIPTNYITIANGPAGTGKTLIAVNKACDMLLSGMVSTIILMRPYVPAGEKYGFLPGEMDQKFAPYLAPYKDYLNDRLGKDTVIKMLADGRIIPEPIGFLQGKTFKNCVMLLDEAANASLEQIKLILTRIGEGTHCVFMGDLAQDYCDESGFAEAMDVLESMEGCQIIDFKIKESVRSTTCRLVLEAFEAHRLAKKKPKLHLVEPIEHVK
jgi:phosphate starvation-inducible PhoH-like protein